MQVPVSSLVSEVLRELRARKWTMLLLFLTVSLGTLFLGYRYPYQYQSSVTIFIDDQNIIRPLMEGSAVTTKISDRSSVAEELIYSKRLLTKLIAEGYWGEALSTDRREGLVKMLRGSIQVVDRGDNFLGFEYSDADQTRAFQVTQKVGQLFISATEEEKREESRNAYAFIDRQVKSYQLQLQESEGILKEFLSANVDGTEGEVLDRMKQLRGQIEQTELDLTEANTRADSIKRLLTGEARTIQAGNVTDIYAVRIKELQEKLDILRLSYHDSYPDIVRLKHQIEDLATERDRHLAAAASGEFAAEEDPSIPNPLYQELRSEYAHAETEVERLKTRYRALQGMMEEEQLRMEKIQENRVELAELTRDNEVNREIYNDLLKRREKARVSMTLDVENQGLSYKIYEPANFPLTPMGPSLSEFAIGGVFLGLIAPFGLIVGFLQLDPRLRFAGVVEESVGIPVLTTIPPLLTPAEQTRERKQTWLVIICFLLSLPLYGLSCWVLFEKVGI